ncbi:MAG: IgGFc-binding protein [Bacteroidota bacterium]|nr:IgGFc-binding protein [Bacteroidota bacterium]
MPSPQGAVTPVYKTSGKEFYLLFLSAIGSDSPSDPSLHRVYISARSRVHGKVSLANGAWVQPFVTNAKGMIYVDLPDWAEMTSAQTEVILPKVFKIEADDEIAVYGLAHKWLSSDGFLVLPVEALGTNYTIASVRNALNYFGGVVNPFSSNSLNPRSECGIAAISDNTTVTVTLTADSYNRKIHRGIPYTFVMNKGEAIQLMARDTAQTGMYMGLLSWVGPLANGIDCDLTGSTITSDKPIAVFSGHERASIPDSLEYSYPNHPSVSRDHIIEQMPPQEEWGKEFVVVPSSQDDYFLRPTTGDIIRVISGSDSTLVFLNGNLQSRLDKGVYTQFPVTRLAHIQTSQPALVVKYLRTALPDSAAPGDPDLTIVPPLENMSSFYSLPTIADGYDFIDHYITILADSLALTTTTLNGFGLDPRIFKTVPGTRYYWTTQRTYAGSQRVESTLPCYAETYGYGPFDSYSFSGGGSFKYLHDLVAKDLDFGKILTGSVKDSLTGVQSVSVPMPLGDSVSIYGYTWESGDTNVFAFLDTIKRPFKIPPGYLLHVNFKFHPTADGSFKAKLRVWSSNTDDVFITVLGQSATRSIAVTPQTINFGSVHVGRRKDSTFSFVASGDVVTLFGTADFNSELLGGPFSADKYPGPYDLQVQIPRSENVHFAPKARGWFRDTTHVVSNALNDPNVSVDFIGRGIDYELNSPGYSFGKIRVGKSSDTVVIPIVNAGDDTTRIKSISFDSGDLRDFGLIDTTIPPKQRLWFLDTAGAPGNGNARSFRAFFAPKIDPANNIVDTGSRQVIVKIVTSDDSVYYVSLSGVGAEPWLIATPVILDFGTITNPLVTSPAFVAKFDTLFNRGSMVGVLDSLRHSDTTGDFSFKSIGGSTISDNTSITENTIVPFEVDFSIRQIGDYVDTLRAHNDSRNEPLVIAKARIRAGIGPMLPISLGVISSCMPVDTTIIIHNPYRVNVSLSSFRFEGDTAGFEFPDANVLHLPVFIAADSVFRLHIRYRFPADSLNGSQTVRVIIDRPTGGDDLSINSDTVLITLTRKTILLNMSAVMPPYRPSAGDAPFRLPIHLLGDRIGKQELDDDTLRLMFSNKLIRAVGIDRTGSLTESTPTNGIPQQPDPVWDEATSTYIVPCVGLHLSSDISKNTLLFTLLCSAYLTKDTAITITPFIGYTSQPCAFRVARDSSALTYANECGDQTIRDLLLTSSVPIHIGSAVPDPAIWQSAGSVTFTYFAGKDLMLSWKIFDPAGVLQAQSPEGPIHAGDGSFSIPLKQISNSGAQYLELTVRDADSGAKTRVYTKFTVTK